MTTALKQQPSDALRLHFYTVALSAPACSLSRHAAPDLNVLTDTMMQLIMERARHKHLDDAVRITGDAASLARRGIFFMQAPARFAEEIRSLEGIGSVDCPAKKSAARPRRAKA